MTEIKVQPTGIWAYFKAHAQRLQTTMLLVAQNDDMSVYVTNDDGVAVFTVFQGDEPMFDHESYAESDIAEEYAAALQEIGLFDFEFPFDINESEDDVSGSAAAETPERDETEEEFDMRIRENELNNAIQNMIYDILGDDIDDVTGDDIEEAAFTVKEAVCDILARQYDMPVYRPMYLVDPDTNERFFSEYPYPQMIHDNS